MDPHPRLRTALIRQGEELLAGLRTAGIRVPESSRFPTYLALLKKPARPRAEARDRGQAVYLQNAKYELPQLYLAWKALGSDPNALPIFAEVVTGKELLYFDGAKASPRDKQFELLLGGVAKLTGHQVAVGEPDVVINPESDWPLHVAAKRPRSLDSAVACIEHGCDQIGRTGGDGIVALDVSVLDGYYNRTVARVHNEVAAAQGALVEFVDELARDHGEALFGAVHASRAAQDGKAIGVLVCASAICDTAWFREEPPADPFIGAVFFWKSFPTITDADPRYSKLAEVTARFQLGR